MKVIHKTRLLAVNGKQLLVIEKIGEMKKLTLPGGIQKKKETLVESLVRETAEEIGLTVNPKHTIHLTSTSLKSKAEITKHHFLLHINSNDFCVIEIEKFKDVYWMHWKKTLDYLDKEDRNAVKKYFKHLKKKTKTII
ncbi:MAG: hypothetical protein Mars2KO_03510 [Maribacter sp.]